MISGNLKNRNEKKILSNFCIINIENFYKYLSNKENK